MRSYCSASASPIQRGDLARVVGQAASVDLLIEDLNAELADRPYEVARVADSWIMRTRPTYAALNKMASIVGGQDLDLHECDVAVLAAIAYHQPITRDELHNIFGKTLAAI